MRNLSKIAILAVLACSFASAQTTTTITGTIRDLTQALVTSGKVTFDLRPSRDTTISGYARFSPQTITCAITGAGLIKALDGTSVCTLTMNTALQPTGSYYAVSIWPANVKTSSFTFYAVLSTYDWSTVVPTPTTSPAQNFVDIFSNQSIGGNKTWLGVQTFNGNVAITGSIAATGDGTFGGNGSFGGNLSVTGNSSTTGNSSVGGNSTVTGNSTTSGTHTVVGNLVGSTASFSGAATAKSVNGVLNAALFSGSDMTAKINAAIASLSGACGKILVPTGTYSVATQLVKPKCIDLDLMGSTLNFGTSALPVVVVGDAGTTTAFTMGAIRNGIINGNGAANTPLGIWIGGDSGAINAPANYSDFLEVFSNLTVQSFAACYKVGYKAYQDMWIGGIIQQCTWGITHSNQYYSENMNLHGTQIFNNTGNAIVVDAGSDFHCYGCSLDYNAGGAIQLQSGGISLHGGNVEQLSGLIINSPASANGLTAEIIGTRLALTNASGTDTSFLNIAGTNSNLVVENAHLIHLHAVTEFVNWQAAGSQNSASLWFHDDNSTTMPATQAAPNIQNLAVYAPYLGAVFSNMTAQLHAIPVGSLPAAAAGNKGTILQVNDSTNVAAEGQTCVGGAGNTALAFSNGTVWKCF